MNRAGHYRVLLSLLLAVWLVGCGGLRPRVGSPATAGAAAPAASIPLPGPTPLPDSDDDQPRPPQTPFYKAWWFWGAIGVVVIGGAAVAIGSNIGGTDRLVQGPDGRFDPQSFPNR